MTKQNLKTGKHPPFNAICKLCRTTTQLRESHIIPSAIFKLIRDKELNYRFYELKNKQKLEIQDGPKEYLLCPECEEKICSYEKYFKEAVHLNRHCTSKAHDDKYFVIENLDYKKIKLFFISLLWRMSISSKPEFENIHIGEDEEIIRKMIINEEPGKSTEYPIFAIIPLINQRNQEGWCTNAFNLKNGLIQIYSFVIGGILYSIFTTHLNTPTPKKFLNETGRWIMPLKDICEIKFLWDAIKDNFEE